jgi:hypothetical protein
MAWDNLQDNQSEKNKFVVSCMKLQKKFTSASDYLGRRNKVLQENVCKRELLTKHQLRIAHICLCNYF